MKQKKQQQQFLDIQKHLRFHPQGKYIHATQSK